MSLASSHVLSVRLSSRPPRLLHNLEEGPCTMLQVCHLSSQHCMRLMSVQYQIDLEPLAPWQISKFEGQFTGQYTAHMLTSIVKLCSSMTVCRDSKLVSSAVHGFCLEPAARHKPRKSSWNATHAIFAIGFGRQSTCFAMLAVLHDAFV